MNAKLHNTHITPIGREFSPNADSNLKTRKYFTIGEQVACGAVTASVVGMMVISLGSSLKFYNYLFNLLLT